MTEHTYKPSLRSQISHELRTPISSMMGFIDFLNDTPLNENQQHYLAYMKISANQLLEAFLEVDKLLLTQIENKT